MPARRLVTEGSYAYCRKPETLGVTAYYLGVSIWIGSPFSIGLTALSAALIIAYIKDSSKRKNLKLGSVKNT